MYDPSWGDVVGDVPEVTYDSFVPVWVATTSVDQQVGIDAELKPSDNGKELASHAVVKFALDVQPE